MKQKEFNLRRERQRLFNQLWIDLQEGNLSLRQIFDDCVEVHNDLDEEFIRLLKEELNEMDKLIWNTSDRGNNVKKAIAYTYRSAMNDVKGTINKLAGEELTK